MRRLYGLPTLSPVIQWLPARRLQDVKLAKSLSVHTFCITYDSMRYFFARNVCDTSFENVQLATFKHIRTMAVRKEAMPTSNGDECTDHLTQGYSVATIWLHRMWLHRSVLNKTITSINIQAHHIASHHITSYHVTYKLE
jgi:hypothetical protein